MCSIRRWHRFGLRKVPVRWLFVHEFPMPVYLDVEKRVSLAFADRIEDAHSLKCITLDTIQGVKFDLPKVVEITVLVAFSVFICSDIWLPLLGNRILALTKRARLRTCLLRTFAAWFCQLHTCRAIELLERNSLLCRIEDRKLAWRKNLTCMNVSANDSFF